MNCEVAWKMAEDSGTKWWIHCSIKFLMKWEICLLFLLKKKKKNVLANPIVGRQLLQWYALCLHLTRKKEKEAMSATTKMSILSEKQNFPQKSPTNSTYVSCRKNSDTWDTLNCRKDWERQGRKALILGINQVKQDYISSKWVAGSEVRDTMLNRLSSIIFKLN